jgi:hypothetical protein
MIVQELVEKLKAFDQTLEVFALDSVGGLSLPEPELRDVTRYPDGEVYLASPGCSKTEKALIVW